MTEGEDGSLWLATSYGVVRRFPDSKQIYYRIDYPRTNGLSSILQDRNGRIWVGRERGGVVIKPESRDEMSLREPLTIRNLDKLAREGADKELFNLPEKPGEILRYSDAEGVVRDFVRFLGETADGHIWISATKGVIDFDGRTFHA